MGKIKEQVTLKHRERRNRLYDVNRWLVQLILRHTQPPSPLWSNALDRKFPFNPERERETYQSWELSEPGPYLDFDYYFFPSCFGSEELLNYRYLGDFDCSGERDGEIQLHQVSDSCLPTHLVAIEARF